MNNILTVKLAAAATTAASTALLTTTVAMDPATAAMFTLGDHLGGWVPKMEIEYGTPDTEYLSVDVEEWTSVKVENDELVFLGEEVRWGSTFLIWASTESVWEVWRYGDYRLFSVRDGSTAWFFGSGDFVRAAEASPREPGEGSSSQPVPEPSGAIALGVLGLGLVASRRRRRS